MNVGSDRVFTRFIPAGAGNTFADTGNTERLAVYPRWRGEHTDCGICSVQILGLSPLARGTRDGSGYYTRRRRFIPAGAGNTLRVNQLECKSPVYPRWRGEHVARRRNKPNKFGLSPLARGTLVRAQ